MAIRPHPDPLQKEREKETGRKNNLCNLWIDKETKVKTIILGKKKKNISG